MKRFVILPGSVVVLLCLGVASALGRPAPAQAGGMPCWLCHGVNFEGSDLAPRVNGTKLTDAEILKQVHNPRGVMPAFGPSDYPDDVTVIYYIRSLPPAGPTKTLTNQERALALSTIAAVAGARAKAAAAADYPTPTPSPTARPTQTSMPALATAAQTATTVALVVLPAVVSTPAPVAAARGASPLDMLVLSSIVLVVGASIVWMVSRR